MAKNNNGSKPVTVEKLGQMLLKYLSPIYEDISEIKNTVNQHTKDIFEIKEILKHHSETLKHHSDEIDKVQRIQLRMEQNLGKKVESLYDKTDLHDQKLANHDRRITKLEKTVV